MKRFFFLFIGFPLLWFAAPMPAYADCSGSVYLNDYHCSDNRVFDLCKQDITSVFSFYRGVYCEVRRDDETEIYEAIAHQFNTEDPELIRRVIAGAAGEDELPSGVKGSLAQFTQQVLTSYEKEKVLYHMKKNLKREFAASEQWYDNQRSWGNMDVMIDLNLIDQMLFGSRAQWNNDVFKFPDLDGEEEPPSAASPGGAPGPSGAAGPTPAETEAESSAAPFDPVRDCVAPDDPNASSNPAAISLRCGNNILDAGEECDDGNNLAGDGCGLNCRLEDIGTLLCQDPEAVTFKNYTPGAASSTPSSRSARQTAVSPPPAMQCPPGTVPRALPQPEPPAGPAQHPDYPGPFIGGVLKQYNPSNQPACPQGSSSYAFGDSGSAGGAGVSGSGPSFGVEFVGTFRADTPCLPVNLCADVNAACQNLFDATCEDAADEMGVALELLFCFDVIKETIPENPYPLNEGCIDCHFRAMLLKLDELMQNGVAPLENTTGSFAISSRWAPNLSFNLNTAIQTKVKPDQKLQAPPDVIVTGKEHIEELRKDWAKQLDPNAGIAVPDIPREANLEDILNDYQTTAEKRDSDYLEQLKYYRLNSDNQKEAQFAGRIGALIRQWTDSFMLIQDTLQAVAAKKPFSEKPVCE